MNSEEALNLSEEMLGKLGSILVHSNCEIKVAGGAARDLMLGRPVKDIDIFVYVERRDMPAVHRTLIKNGYATARSENNFLYALPSAWDITVYNYLDNKDVQAILYTEASFPKYSDEPKIEQFINETFDFGICMIYYGRDGIIRANEAFKIDSSKKCCTFYPRNTLTQGQVVRAIVEHYPRLKEKHYGKFELADQMEKYSVIENWGMI